MLPPGPGAAVMEGTRDNLPAMSPFPSLSSDRRYMRYIRHTLDMCIDNFKSKDRIIQSAQDPLSNQLISPSRQLKHSSFSIIIIIMWAKSFNSAVLVAAMATFLMVLPASGIEFGCASQIHCKTDCDCPTNWKGECHVNSCYEGCCY